MTQPSSTLSYAALEKQRNELLVALKALRTDADNFCVSGVYFTEKCFGHLSLELADNAIANAERDS